MVKERKIKVVYESTNEITLKEAIENVAQIINNSQCGTKKNDNDTDNNVNRIA